MADLKIAVILGSTREPRNGAAVADWVVAKGAERAAADYELVDLRDYPMPFFEAPVSPAYVPPTDPAVVKWADKVAEFDGYVFVTPEYNHSFSAVLKNALDSIYHPFNNKAAAFVSYGAYQGARAVEQLRLVASELQLAHVRQQLGFSLFTDFENMSTFTPGPQHDASADIMFTQLEAWTGALKSIHANETVPA
ncbi:NADPH-dependent FMN reductase [Amnibacterium setariae]|jgi:NAD(P)H-dependent FMN reductase|uniref:NADPH-dependent oxidoreductase n=1 Tax=Amnibacterium setariae TaxID=2306585 RepID=A0A3A1TU17_9MICO|nr:NAD(P)H-dependent oxidoreductase [Amnibacterium setariae]RIX26434.1 NADPH-dependent oxidoreductase [Amnibacterium setariae]